MTWEGSNITGRLGPWPWGGGHYRLTLVNGLFQFILYLPYTIPWDAFRIPAPCAVRAIAEEHVQARIGVIDLLYKLVIQYIFWS